MGCGVETGVSAKAYESSESDTVLMEIRTSDGDWATEPGVSGPYGYSCVCWVPPGDSATARDVVLNSGDEVKGDGKDDSEIPLVPPVLSAKS